MSGGDDRPVSWGRWEEAHARLADQVTALRGDLDAHLRETREREDDRRDRNWKVGLAFLTALVLPLLVTAIVMLATAGLH